MLTNSSKGLLFGPLVGGGAALVSVDFPAWLTAIFYGVLLLLMLPFLYETAYDRTEPNAQEDTEDKYVAPALPWLNFYRTNVNGLAPTPIWTTLDHVLRLSVFPSIAIPIVLFSWTWYWVRSPAPVLFICYADIEATSG